MALGVYVALAALALVGAAALLGLPRARRSVVVAVVGVLGGFASAGWQASLRLAETLPSAIEGQTSSSPASSQASRSRGRAGCAFASSSMPAARPWRARDARARLVRGLARRCRAGAASPDLARRPALALHRAPAPAARQSQSAWLRLRARPVRARRARDRLRARRAAGGAACGGGRLSGRAPAPARARRDLRARRRSPCRRGARRARRRRPGRDRARRLGPLPQHRRRPPDVDQRLARDDVRVARRAGRRRALARQQARDAARRRAARRTVGRPARGHRLRRFLRLGGCRRSARSGCSRR